MVRGGVRFRPKRVRWSGSLHTEQRASLCTRPASTVHQQHECCILCAVRTNAQVSDRFVRFVRSIAPQPGGCQGQRESDFGNISWTESSPYTCRSGFDSALFTLVPSYPRTLLPSHPFGCGAINLFNKRSRQRESSGLWSNRYFNHRSRQCEFATTSTLETLTRSRFSNYPRPGPGTHSYTSLLCSPRVPLHSATYLSHAPVHSVWSRYNPSHAVPLCGVLCQPDPFRLFFSFHPSPSHPTPFPPHSSLSVPFYPNHQIPSNSFLFHPVPSHSLPVDHHARGSPRNPRRAAEVAQHVRSRHWPGRRVASGG